MSKKEKITISIIILFLISLGGLSLSLDYKKKEAVYPEATEKPASKKEELPELPQSRVEIDYYTKGYLEIENTKYEGEVIENESVYNFMNRFKKEGKISFTEKTYTGMGKFIDEINGVKGNGEKNWIYYVNGEKAKIGISVYKLKPGDVVSWKYENDLNN